MTNGICFIIAPIGDPGSPVRKRSDQVSRHIIAPAAKDNGYEPIRAHEIPQPGVITHQIIEQLLDAPMVVADLSGHNPNVLYELAIRHAIRKPLVQMIDHNEALPFDIAPLRTIKFDIQDPDSVEAARGEVARQIASAEKNPGDVDSPLSAAIDLQTLKASGKSTDRLHAEILEHFGQLHREIGRLEGLIQINGRSRFFRGPESGMVVTTEGGTIITPQGGSQILTAP